MTYRAILLPALAVLSAQAPLLGQRWELGVGAGAGIYTTPQTVTAGARSAQAGLYPGAGLYTAIGHNPGRKWGGEIRYMWRMNDLKLSSGTTSARFAAQSHAIGYDFVYHLIHDDASVRPFVSFGGGMRLYQGTGAETVVQPLNQFAYLTQANEWKPMASLAAGVKFRIGRSLLLRLEARNTATPTPTKLIAPAFGATLGGWLHDFTVMGGIAWVY
jgi:hypothetical protein